MSRNTHAGIKKSDLIITWPSYGYFIALAVNPCEIAQCCILCRNQTNEIKNQMTGFSMKCNTELK